MDEADENPGNEDKVDQEDYSSLNVCSRSGAISGLSRRETLNPSRPYPVTRSSSRSAGRSLSPYWMDTFPLRISIHELARLVHHSANSPSVRISHSGSDLNFSRR